MTTIKKITARFNGRCSACNKHHIKAGEEVWKHTDGWAAITCKHTDDRNISKQKLSNLNDERQLAAELGLHLYDYRRMKHEHKARETGTEEDSPQAGNSP